MKYMIVPDGKNEYLFRLSGKTAEHLGTSRERLVLYEALIARLGLQLEFATGQSLFASPEPINAAPEPIAVDRRHTCSKCSTPKVKDGKLSDGRQRWRCLKCWPRTTGSKQSKSRRLGSRSANFQGNPKCDRCRKPMHIRGRHKDNIYYKCKRCPPLPRGLGRASLTLEGDQLEKFVRAKVTKANGHDPQIRDDVIQEIVKDILERKLVPRELDTETIRRYIRSQARLSQDKHREVSIDAPVSNDSTVTIAESLEG
jgi:hypothetical protein